MKVAVYFQLCDCPSRESFVCSFHGLPRLTVVFFILFFFINTVPTDLQFYLACITHYFCHVFVIWIICNFAKLSLAHYGCIPNAFHPNAFHSNDYSTTEIFALTSFNLLILNESCGDTINF